MKILLTLLTLIIATTVKAEIPEYLKDGIITVTLKDGSVHKFSTNDHKVVKRFKAPTLLEPAIVAQSKKSTEQRTEEAKNSVIFHAGMGKDGLSLDHNGSKHTVKEKYEAVGGLTYCRKAKDDASVCGTGMTNNTFTLGLKFDF
jgi:hypothetical protein